MLKEAVLHIPFTSYAHAIDEKRIVFRLRAARDDLKCCALCFGDRACRMNPVEFSRAPMAVAARDERFDYFEVTLDSPYSRVCYFFELFDGAETALYYADRFESEKSPERSDYYQFPFNLREEIADIPGWARDAVVYNIFPDSFATGRNHISGQPSACALNGYVTAGKRGGTLAGIRENLGYIRDLGVNCIYINPIFVAGEYHKYDVLDYFNIDPCFGANEDFRALVSACHVAGIRIIIDGVFNHCSWNFFAFEDVVKNGETSAYKDWFYGLKFPVARPENGDDVPEYDCFAYERKMPKINTSNKDVIEYFCRVCRYWLDEYDIDGWRLDVADEVGGTFWRAFRAAAKSVKPDCFLIGEVWGPAQPWLTGDQFDSTMNYDFRRSCRDFFAFGKIDAAGFDSRVTAMRLRYGKNMLPGQLNLLDSHDVPRFLSMCGGDARRMKLAILFQIAFIGIPTVFYGDERGLAGILEDEYRQPMKWDGSDESRLFRFYRDAIMFRNAHEALRRGEYETLWAQEGSGLYAFRRHLGEDQVIVVLNASNVPVAYPHHLIIWNEPGLSEGADIVNHVIGPWGYMVFD
jgi:cyclomaltodextrinase